MQHTAHSSLKRAFLPLLALIGGFSPVTLLAQGGAATAPAPRPASAVPSWAGDLPGYWVSLITDNWRMRMVTPPKGDYVGIPVTAAAVKIADTWDPAKDSADGQQCRSYGAAMIMMRPERLHVSWQDDHKTLLMELDGGTQTRLFHFGTTVPPDTPSGWQGYSLAQWTERVTSGIVQGPPEAQYLYVSTTRMLPGYLRQNGIPYSADALLEEYYEFAKVSDREKYLIVSTSVTDPKYLQYPLQLSAIFRKEPNNAGWNPEPCSSTW